MAGYTSRAEHESKVLIHRSTLSHKEGGDENRRSQLVTYFFDTSVEHFQVHSVKTIQYSEGLWVRHKLAYIITGKYTKVTHVMCLYSAFSVLLTFE